MEYQSTYIPEIIEELDNINYQLYEIQTAIRKAESWDKIPINQVIRYNKISAELYTALKIIQEAKNI